MRFAALIARAGVTGQRAAARRRDGIIANADLPRDVRIKAGADGIILSGRRLRLRMINDVRLRNIARKGGPI